MFKRVVCHIRADREAISDHLTLLMNSLRAIQGGEAYVRSDIADDIANAIYWFLYPDPIDVAFGDEPHFDSGALLEIDSAFIDDRHLSIFIGASRVILQFQRDTTDGLVFSINWHESAYQFDSDRARNFYIELFTAFAAVREFQCVIAQEQGAISAAKALTVL